jgi:pyruvate,water dikinase
LIPPGFVIPKNSAELSALAGKLGIGFTGNIVVEMGIALFRLAKLLDKSDIENISRLSDRISNRQMSTEFMGAWDAFLVRFGCRGPLEMDLASPRYADDPGLALRQMSFMIDGEGFNPDVAHTRNIEERRRAYEDLMSRLGWLRRKLLRRIHKTRELFVGTRDTPKHHLVLLTYALRKRAFIEGRRLVEENRIDTAEEVFDLTFRDLEAAAQDLSMDLRKIREDRTRFLKILKARVTEFPNVIDSRGRILRPPPRKEKAGEMSGIAVSPGVVIGRVKILRNPYEKSIDKGDVLVAYITDPGWTPLFVNAAAVLLEIGGVLQHGAVIAREYGKPCVVGIDGLMTKFYDGQKIEVDGTAGVVRLLP